MHNTRAHICTATWPCAKFINVFQGYRAIWLQWRTQRSCLRLQQLRPTLRIVLRSTEEEIYARPSRLWYCCNGVSTAPPRSKNSCNAPITTCGPFTAAIAIQSTYCGRCSGHFCIGAAALTGTPPFWRVCASRPWQNCVRGAATNTATCIKCLQARPRRSEQGGAARSGQQTD